MTIDTVETFLLAEELLILNEDFVQAEKFLNFASLHREFEERELLTQLNEENDFAEC